MKTTNVFARVINRPASLDSLTPVRKFVKKEIASFENGRIVIREDLKALFYRKREKNLVKIEELKQELQELEVQLRSTPEDEVDSLRSNIRKVESQLKFELQEEFMDKKFYIQFNSISEVQRAIELMEDRQADRLDQALYVIWAPRLNIDLENIEDYVDDRPLFPWVWNINPNLEKYTEALD